MSWVHHLEEQDRLIPPPSPLTHNAESPSPIVEDDPVETEFHSAPPPSQPYQPRPRAPMTEQVSTEQMLQLMQQMQQQILNLQQQNQILLGNLPAQATGHVAPAYALTHKKVKVPTPNIFDGKRNKVEHFIRQCSLVFAGDPTNFAGSTNKITYALSLICGGLAQEWAGLKLDQRTAAANGEPNAVDPFTGWIDFVYQLEEHFGDPNKEETAQRKLQEIKQGGRASEDFVTDFQTYQIQTGYDEKALILIFKTSMNRSILQTIYGFQRIPNMLKDWQDTAIAVDRRRREYQMFVGGSQNSPRPYTGSGRNPPPPTWTPPPPQRDPNAMDVDRSKTRGGNRTCFNCGKEGHFWAQCPEPQKPCRARVAEMRDDEYARMVQEEMAWRGMTTIHKDCQHEQSFPKDGQ